MPATEASGGQDGSLILGQSLCQYSSTIPAKAAYRIILIGFIFIQYVPMNVAAKRKLLIQNCQGEVAIEPKLSGVRRSRVERRVVLPQLGAVL